jgi:hypothetical protein
MQVSLVHLGGCGPVVSPAADKTLLRQRSSKQEKEEHQETEGSGEMR